MIATLPSSRPAMRPRYRPRLAGPRARERSASDPKPDRPRAQEARAGNQCAKPTNHAQEEGMSARAALTALVLVAGAVEAQTRERRQLEFVLEGEPPRAREVHVLDCRVM